MGFKVKSPLVVTVSELMEVMRLNRNTIHRHIQRGQIKAFKVSKSTYRIPVATLPKEIRDRFPEPQITFDPD